MPTKTLSLKVGQQLDVKVIKADIQAAKNAITLSIGNKNISVESSQPIALTSGQPLKIQVTQIAPSIEFKIIEPELKSQTAAAQIPKNPLTEVRLTLNSTAKDDGSVAMGTEPMRPTAKDGGSVAMGNLTLNEKTDSATLSLLAKQPIDTKIIAIAGNKIQLQLMTEPNSKQPTLLNIERSQLINAPSILKIGQNLNLSVNAANGNLTVNEKPLSLVEKQAIDAKIIAIAGNKIQLQLVTEPGSKQPTLLNIERSQLVNAPSTLKIGQSLNLEVAKTGGTPEFKIIASSAHIPEAKVAEFITQFLPRHEASPILLNQLIKDLPQLLENQSVSQTLKDIAAKIIQNLPPKEQLITSQGLKQSIANSGLFLEAKLPSMMNQSELINALPELIKNESVPQSLQRIAAEILQNLTQKNPAAAPTSLTPDAQELEQTLAKTLKPAVLSETTGDTKTATPAAISEDFKASLLKFIHALKQELTQQSEQKANQADVELLKNLQNKSENTVAKVVLDQLMSLPKEDNPKQLWVIDIPFIDRQQAETVKIEIQRDKDNEQQADNGDWSVNITITPPELGTIHCAVSYWNATINTFFKSQNSQTTELIKHNLDYLKNQLETAGLTIGHMDAHDGSQKTPPPHPLSGKKLFDDKA
ncbi:MAG: flagellar hook-length control protein FliK [Methylobacter sp.]|nr:flagellar hook-length control protein FliK [Methylobacter sp.]